LEADQISESREAIILYKLFPLDVDTVIKEKSIAMPPQDENRLNGYAVEPRCRAGVPRPAAASGVRRGTVDVTRQHIGFDFVAFDFLGRVRVPQRVEQVEQFPRASAVAEQRRGLDDPGGGVGILPAVLADAGHVA